MNSKMYKFLLVVLFVSQCSYGQISNFALTVTKTNETCTANGSLSFSITTPTVGAALVYTIYQLPNVTTPIAVLNTGTFTGLVAGNYRVVATQSLGNDTASEQQDVTIVNQIVLLTYQLVGNNELCGYDGKITVNVTTGTATQYEIIEGPILKPLQTSNIFTGLVGGLYKIRVFDACGEAVVREFTIFTKSHDLTIFGSSYQIESCTSATVVTQITAVGNSIIAYPLSVQWIVHPPGGGTPVIYNNTFIGGPPTSIALQRQIILYPNQLYTCDVIITDACGNVYSENGTIVSSNTTPYPVVGASVCGLRDLTIFMATAATITSAPIGYTGPLPYVLPVTFAGPKANLPAGNYTLTTVDVCGTVRTLNVTIQSSVTIPLFNYANGCEIGFGSIKCINTALQSISILSAPAAFNFTLPYDVSFNLNSTGQFYMNSFPAGTYVFRTVDSCGISRDHTVILPGLSESIAFNIIRNCGSFDIAVVSQTTNLNALPTLFLQKYNPATNEWGHPATGIVYSGGTPTLDNSIQLSNPISYNFGYTGTFRIMESFAIYGNATFFDYCYKVVYEFEYSGLPKINDVYSFSCNNGTYDVIVDATGVAPLVYRITQKNGLPFVLENATSNVFLGLEAATYNFQVEDPCGNILNSDFEVPGTFNFGITANSLCSGQPGSLTLPNFSILQYEWWKDNATSTILSTSNSLPFPAFNPAINAGVYHVRVRYTGNPNSCIDFVLEYTITPNGTAPNAGQNGSADYCGAQGIIDLFSLLQGSYDANGTWQEITTSGTLANNLWNSESVPAGNYQFSYRVDGFCGATDQAIVNILIKPIPETPEASVDPIVCETESLNLFATPISSGVYNWTGPNGFTSNDQNPVINDLSPLNNGVYSVKTIQGDCESGISSVNVLVKPLPNFSLTSACINGSFTVTAAPIDNSFDVNAVSYSWVGPNNFSAIGNPIILTGGEKGDYTLTILDGNGCAASKSIDVPTTVCSISNVITPNGDAYNQSFDVSGLDVKRLEIYSRWGRLVYDKDQYINEWEGQNNEGGRLPDSTYYYLIFLNSGVEKHGWVFLGSGR